MHNSFDSSTSLLKLITMEFKECLLDSPSFRASILYKTAMVENNFSNLDKDTFTFEDLDHWIYSDLVDNQIIRIYHNYIRPKLLVFNKAKARDFFLLDDKSIHNINKLLVSFKNYIGDFHQYQEKLGSIVKTYCVTDYNNRPELMKQESFNLYTFKIKNLNNSLNLVHELKNFKININLEILHILIKIIQNMNNQKKFYSTGEWVYSETCDKLQNLVANANIIQKSQQNLNKDINVNKNLIMKSFKNEYDPITSFNNYELHNIKEKIEEYQINNKNLVEFKTWFLMEIKDKNGVEKYVPRFVYVKKNLFGLFQLSNDCTYVTESDKFGLELINFKLLDYNNEQHNFRKYSFLLEFKDPSSSNSSNDDSDYLESQKPIVFSIKFQSVSFIALCKLYTVFKNCQERIAQGKISNEEKQLTNKRFAPLFKEFMLEDTNVLVNPNNKDSVSLIKRLEQYTHSSFSIEQALYCFANIDLPIITSFTRLAIFANVYVTLGDEYIPNAIIANTWGSEYWPTLYNYRSKEDEESSKTPLLSQLFIKTQSDGDLTFQNAPFKALFGHISNERAVLSLNCFTYFKGDKNSKTSDMMFQSSIYATHKKLYIYLNSYGFISLLSIPFDEIINMELVHSGIENNLDEPLTMIIYDKKKLNITIKISFVQYYEMPDKYSPPDKQHVDFSEIISLVSFKEKILYLIEDLHNKNKHTVISRGQSEDKRLSKSMFNVKRTSKQDEELKAALYKIDYKYYKHNQKYNKLVLFETGQSSHNNMLNTDMSFNKIENLLISNKNTGSKADIINDAKYDSNINIIEFKTTLSIKNNWSKIHKLEVPIELDAMALLLLGRKNVFTKKLFKYIHKNEDELFTVDIDKDVVEKEVKKKERDSRDYDEIEVDDNSNNEDGSDRNDYSWYNDNKSVYRYYNAILREKKVFNSFRSDDTDENGSNRFDTNEIIVVEKVLQYIPNENLIFKMEFGKFDIPILGSIIANLYLIIERAPFSSTKSIISFYFDLWPEKDIGSGLLQRLIFEILKNYLYKRHLKVMTFFKHTIAKFYRGMGNKGQYIQCLNLSGKISILKTNGEHKLTDLKSSPVTLNRVTLAKLIIQHYLLKGLILFFAFVKKLYLITGILITNITLINKTIAMFLIGSVVLNFLLITREFGKNYMMSNKLNNFNKILMDKNDKPLLERSLTLKDMNELIDNFDIKEHDKSNKIWSNFEQFKVKDNDYRFSKTKLGIDRNKLLVELSSLYEIEVSQLNFEFAKFINYELDNCLALEKVSMENLNLSEISLSELQKYCQDIKNLYIDKNYKNSAAKDLL